MPCHTRMKTIFLQGLVWMCLLNFGLVLCVIEPGKTDIGDVKSSSVAPRPKRSGTESHYLDFDNLPDTNFSCVGKVIGGYYADLETSCQMFHVCTIGQLDEPMDIRFLCLNGTVFDQETRVCERVDEVDCSKSERFYHLNLELYGNTAPPLLEEPGNTEAPIISSSTSTTTPRPTSTSRTTRGTFFTTSAPSISPTTHSTPKVITSNQFPVNSGPDIRFNPEEINIRLTPGSPPIIKNPSIIKSPSVSFQQQNFNGDSRITVTTHSTVYKDDRTSQKSVATTQKPKSVVSYGLQHTSSRNYQPNYDYNYQHTENSDADYHTDLPSSEYADLGYDGHMNFESTNQKKQVFGASTKRVENKPFISSTAYPSSPQPSYQKTDKPQNLQLPLPFPTLPPLTFSSPAPFTLSRHVETKRSNDAQRPRIIVSASASVSDASGRRLNYSLGTIGSHILGKPPHSYDEYKEGDEGLDPFYHDVPKVGGTSRQKRDTEEDENSAKEVASTEETEHTTHWVPPEYVDDNYEPFTYNNTEKNITVEETTKATENDEKPTEPEYDYYYEYVDDNYEPSIYDKENTTKETILTTTDSTEPSYETATQETTIESNIVTESMKQYHTDTTEEPITTTELQDDYKITDAPEETTVNSESYEMTTNIPQTITEDEESIRYHFDSISQESIETLTTTELTTMSSDSLNEQIITTPPTTTENYNPTTENNEPTTPYIETTSESIISTLDHETESTTDNNLYTTGSLETTLDIDSQKIETTTELNKETTTEFPTTTEYFIDTTTEVSTTSTTTSRYQYLRTREPAYKRYSRTKPTRRHRFSSPAIHMSQSVLKLRGNKISNPTSPFTSSEEIASEVISHRLNKIVPESKSNATTTLSYDGVSVTDAPLSKSANPTEPKNTKSPSTTPITKTLFIPRRFTYDVMKSFNCFNKEMNKFYEDPRDCRLFHYCTPGYSATQVLDMKFVCDYGTYFDSDKLICTKIKPQRCK